MKTKLRIVFAILIVVLIGIVVYLQFFYKPGCNNFFCFQEKMKSCEKYNFINEAEEATWYYEIKGKTTNDCQIYVKMLNAKKGELGIDSIVGYDMVCSYPLGVGIYPEKDIGKCHGRLKEELQNIIINKLHSYIIENLGKVDEALSKAV